MGDAADDAEAHFFNNGGFSSKPRVISWQSGSGAGKWKDASGRIHDMKDMETRHIQNCIRMCQRNGNTGKERDLQAELTRRQGKPSTLSTPTLPVEEATSNCWPARFRATLPTADEELPEDNINLDEELV